MSTNVRFHTTEQNIGTHALSGVNGDVWLATVDRCTVAHVAHMDDRTFVVKGASEVKDARNAVRAFIHRDVPVRADVVEVLPGRSAAAFRKTVVDVVLN